MFKGKHSDSAESSLLEETTLDSEVFHLYMKWESLIFNIPIFKCKIFLCVMHIHQILTTQIEDELPHCIQSDIWHVCILQKSSSQYAIYMTC